MVVIVRGAVPLLVIVTIWVGADVRSVVCGKVSEVGEMLTTGASATPMPVRETVCGEPVMLSAMLTAAVSVPAAAGLKVTVIAQLAPIARPVPQVLVSE